MLCMAVLKSFSTWNCCTDINEASQVQQVRCHVSARKSWRSRKTPLSRTVRSWIGVPRAIIDATGPKLHSDSYSHFKKPVEPVRSGMGKNQTSTFPIMCMTARIDLPRIVQIRAWRLPAGQSISSLLAASAPRAHPTGRVKFERLLR